ncbi:NUDIX hydrolase [Bacillus sp. NEB1478]|uniref:NUDIX hydrolase n=1 Tax=Bacillus sp. NEB1478 TaxID=3073816 RepID=UPI00287393DF|nr:NUDIX hydrolase [Bacillus sp. NEB1478]WNB91274.1 NUDIX hydrolase [Bacillus sp. NEB1478]
MNHPKHIVSVSALVQNDQGETLLLKTHFRPDTWEMPGGQVEEGEPLEEAVCREVLEETGIEIELVGVTGVYYNTTRHVLTIIYKAKYITGTIVIQPEEVQDARFIAIDEHNISDWITRPHSRSRTLHAMANKETIKSESWKMDPYELISCT